MRKLLIALRTTKSLIRLLEELEFYEKMSGILNLTALKTNLQKTLSEVSND